MTRFRTRCICSGLFIAVAFSFSPIKASEEVADAPETITNSKVTEVTLYRNQALVTRTVEIDGDAGASEIIVGDLPENIDPSTMFAEGDENVEVRAVRYRARAVGDSPREEVRVLEEEIKSIGQRLNTVAKQITLVQKQSKYLDKLESFTPPTADFDLGRGVLDAESVEKLTLFSFTTREGLLETEVELNQKQAELQQTLNLTQRKVREITNGSSNQQRQAILFVQKMKPGAARVRLNYLTNGCRWSPTYTVRAESGAEKVNLEYNGLIQQMSGEDWSDVKLTLSTASPAISAAGPSLAPFQLTLVPGNSIGQNYAVQAPNSAAQQEGGQYGQGLQPNAFKDLIEQQQSAISSNRKATSNSDNLKTSWAINNAINNFECFAIAADSPDGFADMAGAIDQSEEPVLTYEIKSPVSLQSRNSQQMVRVLTAELDSDFYHVATPALTSYVYREAELANGGESDLLQGPLTVYLDGRFVGRSEIPTVARGQDFVVGFGADSQLRSRRELVDRSKRINGGNRETTLEYKLVVENYKDAAVAIRVVDRMPIAGDDSKIRVTLGEGVEDELSDDGVYVKSMRPKGILRWDTEIKGRSIGEEAYEIDYSFKLEHDRQYVVSLPGNQQQQELEYNELENNRRGGKR